MAQVDGASMIRNLRAALRAGRHVAFIILTGDASTQLGCDIADVPVFLKPSVSQQRRVPAHKCRGAIVRLR